MFNQKEELDKELKLLDKDELKEIQEFHDTIPNIILRGIAIALYIKQKIHTKMLGN